MLGHINPSILAILHQQYTLNEALKRRITPKRETEWINKTKINMGRAKSSCTWSRQQHKELDSAAATLPRVWTWPLDARIDALQPSHNSHRHTHRHADLLHLRIFFLNLGLPRAALADLLVDEDGAEQDGEGAEDAEDEDDAGLVCRPVLAPCQLVQRLCRGA